MLVMDWMSKPAITVDQNNSLIDAMEVLKQNNIMMVPVMKRDELVGIVSDRDLKKSFASSVTPLAVHELFYLMAKIKMKDIMSRNPITVPFDYTIEETAEVLLKHKISGVPVLDEKRELVGVITQRDIFKALISLTGVGKRGIQFAFLLEDRPGSIKDVADIIREYGGRIVSILSRYDQAPEGHRFAYIRIYGIDGNNLPPLKIALKEAATVRYMVDHNGDNREIYRERENSNGKSTKQ
ncbi:MAG: CBS and ACT domain-containing protein [Desulfatiglandaceae bacterium]|jgi:acetoin utilization protein AcuB